MDKYQLAQVFSPDAGTVWTLRQGQVVSVQSDYTVTVKIAGSDTEIAGVRYIGSPPPPSSGVWLWSSGTDLFVEGSLAAAGQAIAPRAYRTSDLVINSGSVTQVTWQADDADPYGMWNGSAPSYVIVNVPGRYIAVAQADFSSSSAGVRSASILVNGAVVGANSTPGAASVAHMNITSMPFTVSATASVELVVEQNSSASLSLIASGNVSPGLGIYYLGA